MNTASVEHPLKQVLFNFHDVILLITAYLCLLFALLVLTRKGPKTQNALLAAFLICHAAIPLDILISFGEAFSPWIAERAPGLFYIFGGAYWLDAPILLLYTRSLLYKDFRFRKLDLLFLLPFLYFFVNQWDFIFLSQQEKVLYVQNATPIAIDIVIRIQTCVREIIRFGFFIACFIELYRYRKVIRHEFSNIEKIDFNWLNMVVVSFTVLMLWQLLVMAALELYLSVDSRINFEVIGLAGNYATLGIVSLLIFFSLSHSVVFEGIDRQALKGPESKTKKIVFDSRDIDRLTGYMEKEKPYLNSDLNINELAKLTKINHRQLSNMMNQHFQKNFFEFVNHYRIEEAKALLTSEEHRNSNVLDIMYEVGFNSKATFNTFFKKYTGLTPSQYRKNN